MTHADPHRSPTLATLAAAAGVSRMTVSNAFNRPDQLSPALREKILSLAAELGYAGPDPVARTLARGTAGAIGLVFDYPLTLALADSVTVELLKGVAAECEARELGLSLVPRIAGRDAALVRTALVDGFVLWSLPDDDPRLQAVRERRLPYVLVDHQPIDGVHAVTVDDRAGARAMAEHLLDLGHRRFAIVVGWDVAADTAAAAEDGQEMAYHTMAERFAGWREALVPAGIDWARVAVASGPGQDRATGRIAGAAVLDRDPADRPTAVLSISDLMALGVMDTAAERGVAVPGDLSVAGFDDAPEAARATPPLTTVRQPHAGKGAAAVRLLLDGGPPRHVRLPTDVVVRSTTAPRGDHA